MTHHILLLISLKVVFKPLQLIKSSQMNIQSLTYWHSTLQGKSLPIHENDPQEGWYRTRPRKGYRSLPVRIWRDEASGELLALRDGKRVDPYEVWTWVCLNPVSVEAYEAVLVQGAQWPDEIGLVGQGLGDGGARQSHAERRKLRSDGARPVKMAAKVTEPTATSDMLTANVSSARSVRSHSPNATHAAVNLSYAAAMVNSHSDSKVQSTVNMTAGHPTKNRQSDGRVHNTDKMTINSRSADRQVPALNNPAETTPLPDHGRLGHNSQTHVADCNELESEDIAVTLKQDLSALKSDVLAWLSEVGEIADQVTADRCANYADAFASFEKQAEELRTKAKKPVLDQGRAIDAQWKPLVSQADEGKRLCKKALEPFLIVETERLEKELIEQLQAENGDLSVLSSLAVSAKAGTFGRTISLRRVRKVRVLDRNALLAHYHRDPRFLNDEAVQKLLAKLAEHDLQAGQNVPGADSVEEKVAA
ncbi:hypothetical protein KIH24_14930 [Rhizobiales bacterium TNE-4]|nr:hypothetical protein [Rhizobiales bacterium TNE-4]MBV1828916.1 hypothetical protein [Rhizobiales bacterium TNE-4]